MGRIVVWMTHYLASGVIINILIKRVYDRLFFVCQKSAIVVINMLFSIIIPAYNEGENLKVCIDSCKKQSGDFEYEIIVVDNNSVDNTFAVAESLGVKVFKQEKQGVGWARRMAVENSRGDYIVSIDADTHLPENYLLETKKRFNKKKRLVCLGGQMFFYDGTWWQNILRAILHWPLYWFAYIASRGKLGPMGNNMSFPRELYDKVGGFDPKLKFGEDADLSAKLFKYGKVKLDMSLKCWVSARRFRPDNKGLWIYILNFVKLCVTGRPYKNELSSHI